MESAEPVPENRRQRSLPVRLVELYAGLALWGLAVALFVGSDLGLGPWDAFHYGLHRQTGLTIGMASIVAGVVVLGTSVVLGLKPGFGTISNMIFIGVFIDLMLLIVPPATSLPWSIAYYAAGLPLCGLATGMYIGAGLGPGPRDSLMVVLAVRTGATVRRVRTFIELTVLAVGWLMGGSVGVGTVLFATTIGFWVHWGMRLFRAEPNEGAMFRSSITVKG